MAYYIDLFSPDTYEAYKKSDQTITGFRPKNKNAASKIKIGDKLVCYVTKLGRWIGISEIQSAYFIDDTPRFSEINDPFNVRFKVKVLALLPLEKAIPIRDNLVWNSLSFTKGFDKKSSRWTSKIRTSLNELSEKDGKFLEEIIIQQTVDGKLFPYDEAEYKKYLDRIMLVQGKRIIISTPAEPEPQEIPLSKPKDYRESYKIQALICEIGAKMGLKIWVPRNDRGAILALWKNEDNSLIDTLPLNYDEATLNTIEQIDVLWVNKRAIVRAFEVEHTTAIYSGILRMADLMALQPNMVFNFHIVAPIERKDKVFQEIRRPVFSVLEKGPLSENCTYISYDSIVELSGEKHLSSMSHKIIDEYAEEVE